ncbi:MAG: HAD-IA family hydrolase [Planctomycetota bacterium]
MRFDAVMFDLDGTLADTLRDLSEAGNHAMAVVGRPTYSLDEYRTLVGQGLDRLIHDALGPEHQDLFDQAIAAFRGYYAEHRYDHCAPYPGIAALLDALTAAGSKLAVMSNKPDEATVDMVQRVFGAWDFAAVRGHREGYPVKPDPTAALEIAEELGVPPERWLYVGDTDVDMQTGKRAGFFTVGVTWGFRSRSELESNGADYLTDRPAQVLDALDRLPSDPESLRCDDVHIRDHEPHEYGPYVEGFRAVRLLDQAGEIRAELVWRVGVGYHAEITDIGVIQPLDRRRGLGTRLLAAGLEGIKKYYRDQLNRPLRRVYLFCDETNPAGRAFYEALGFKRKANVPDLETYCDLLIYVLDCDKDASAESESPAIQSM